jgi:hypothetical protein
LLLPITTRNLEIEMKLKYRIAVTVILMAGAFIYVELAHAQAGETRVPPSSSEMAREAQKMLSGMEGYHVRVLELQASARKAKDVIKLNCVNENLLAVKQLLNIADKAENDLNEAIASSDRNEQVHQFSQITLAHERAVSASEEAAGCIGEELHFVGKNDIEINGPAMPDDPTNDPQDPFDVPSFGSDIPVLGDGATTTTTVFRNAAGQEIRLVVTVTYKGFE